MQGVQCIAHSAAPSEACGSKAVSAVAERSGQSAAAVLYKWSTQRGVPVVLDSLEHITDADAFYDWKLSEEADKVRTAVNVQLRACIQDVQSAAHEATRLHLV